MDLAKDTTGEPAMGGKREGEDGGGMEEGAVKEALIGNFVSQLRHSGDI